MIVVNFILFVLMIALGASLYYYYKEKKLLKEFVRHSRRHQYHQDIDHIRKQKANRYLSISMILFFIALPLFIQNFTERFMERNWKWVVPAVSATILLCIYKDLVFYRNNRVNKPLAVNINNSTNS